jgi:hypothetical protein
VQLPGQHFLLAAGKTAVLVETPVSQQLEPPHLPAGGQYVAQLLAALLLDVAGRG